MKNYLLPLAIGLFGGLSNFASADAVSLPIQLDYGLIKKAVDSQLFKAKGGIAEVWHDKHKCSFLNLSNPRISGADGQIKLLNDVTAQIGTSFGGQCVPMLAWEGALETYQKPAISSDRRVLSLPVTAVNAYDRQGRQLAIDKLEDLIRKAAAPKLADIKVDLNRSRGDIEKTLSGFVPKDNAGDVKRVLDTLQFESAEANDYGIKVKLGFDAPLKKIDPKPEAPFTASEQQAWQTAWKEWDAFLTKAIDQASSETQSQELKDTLTEILVESRTAFKAGLTAQAPKTSDPVRVFFTDTWQKLAPHLKTLAKQLPEVEGLRYLTFIAATDVIYELESLGAPFGLEITSDGLRRLARTLMANKDKERAV